MRAKYRILPFLVKIILWGSAVDDNTRKVPMGIRILLALLLLIVCWGLAVLLLWVGFAENRAMLILLGVMCLICLPLTVLLELKLKKEQ